MLAALVQPVLCTYMGEIEMSDIINFQGYLISQESDSFTIYSPYVVDNLRVFGHDSDYTTIAISLIKHLLNNGVEVLISQVDDKISFTVLNIATGIELVENGNHLQCGEDASVVMSSTDDSMTDLANVPSKPLDQELYQSVKEAWKTELDIRNISQGAYVSMQQYDESLSARLSLIAQNDGTIIWPPRQMNRDGVKLSKGSINLSPNASVMTWTNLSAAGAPSEFAIRAPILGGLTTVMVEFSEGPKGVFLMVDDEERKPIIGDSVEFVVRMLYGQEGIIRYGAKARICSSQI